MSNQTSLRGELLTLIGGSLLLMLIAAFTSKYMLDSAIESKRNLIDGPVNLALGLDQVNSNFKTQVQEWKNVLLRGKNPAELDKHWSAFEAQERKIQEALDELLKNNSKDGVLSVKIGRLKDELKILGNNYRKGKEAFIAAGFDSAAGDAAVKGIDRAASTQINELVGALQEKIQTESAQVTSDAERVSMLTSIGLVAIFLAVVGVSLWLVNTRLVAPLQSLTGIITHLAQGKFDQRADTTRTDELGQLAHASNTLRDFLVETFASLKQGTDALDHASGELSSISALMSQGTHDQFSRTDQAATAMHEMTATAQEVARHAADAARAADDADNSARQGETVMQSTIQTITEIRGEIANTTTVIRRLEEDSARIGKVLEVIRGIAEQTNLLALNAAIEAARAGDAGRGFAVVADEVRTLAQRTAESTAEIHQIIDTVQSGALNAVHAIEGGQRRSEEGVEQVTQAGAMLQRITASIEAIRDMNRQIATAAEEQTAVADDISMNLSEITTIASNNEHNVQRTQATSETLNQLSVQLGSVTSKLHT